MERFLSDYNAPLWVGAKGEDSINIFADNQCYKASRTLLPEEN